MDLHDVATELTRSLGIRHARARPSAAARQTLFRKWQSSITTAERCAFLHKLCWRSKNIDAALKSAELVPTTRTRCTTEEWFRNEQANCLRILGRYKQGLRVIEQTIKVPQPIIEEHHFRGSIQRPGPHINRQDSSTTRRCHRGISNRPQARCRLRKNA